MNCASFVNDVWNPTEGYRVKDYFLIYNCGAPYVTVTGDCPYIGYDVAESHIFNYCSIFCWFEMLSHEVSKTCCWIWSWLYLNIDTFIGVNLQSSKEQTVINESLLTSTLCGDMINQYYTVWQATFNAQKNENTPKNRFFPIFSLFSYEVRSCQLGKKIRKTTLKTTDFMYFEFSVFGCVFVFLSVPHRG